MDVLKEFGPVEYTFYGCLAVLVYTYVGYPLLLQVWGSIRKKSARFDARVTPRVTIVIAAWNEAGRIASRLNNCLQQEYPAELLDIVVVSDGSTDATSSIVHQSDAKRVSLVELDTRMGKAVALNCGVAAARGEIVVFADARQSFSPNAVRDLVANFADPAVGAVSGELILESNPGESASSEGIGLYWQIEKWIRQKEADIDSIVGATGAIYAIRKELFEPLPPGTILDDLLTPMRIAMRGYRVVFEKRALAFDQVTTDYRSEFKRKVRTLAGNYQAISLCPRLIQPWSNRLFIQFVSHKVCRLGAPLALVGLFLTNLVHLDGWFAVLMGVQAFGYSMALTGWGLCRMGIRERLTSAAFTFCLLNYAALVGAVQFLRSETVQWEKAG
ncbi:glycosyltransferase family 2 protein [Candidatus Nitrospira bockiana]